jgi:CheY-like chemotaxis protein
MNGAWTAPRSHAVQFYDNEQFVQQAIADFFTQGARQGDPLILVSRLRTFEGVAAHLASGRSGSADAADRILFFDAEVTLPQIMDGENLDSVRAERLLKHVLSQSCPSHAQGTVRLYGEVVDILCQRGLHSAALEFEGIAHSLLDFQPQLSILCGYAIERFDDDTNAARIRSVCQKHTHVIPAESFTDALHGRMLATQPTPRMRTFDGTPPVQAVYVVDDDPSMRRSLRRLLTLHSWPVRTFDSAEAFLAELDTLSSGCLVADIGLPGISGLELVQRLAEARLSWPTIVMSGLHDKKTESEAMRLGARAYLRKPFNSQALLNAVARALFISSPSRAVRPAG